MYVSLRSDLALAEDALWEGSLQSAIQVAQGLRAANDVQDGQPGPSHSSGANLEGQQKKKTWVWVWPPKSSSSSDSSSSLAEDSNSFNSASNPV